MKALNQKNIAECSKNCVKTLKSWTRQFSHASGFRLLMVLRLCFWRIGLNVFQWDVSLLPAARYLSSSSSSIPCASQAGQREEVLWCVNRGGIFWGKKKKAFSLPCTQAKSFLKFVCRLIVQLFSCCFGLFSELVLRSYLSVCFQLFLPSFSAQWSFGKTK